ncbi:glycosyltransferase family 4 protein [Thalassospira marina]|nr:glycosyltransferase family 4 protein [Thalassospira marina]
MTTPTYPPFNSGLGNAVQQQARALVSEGMDVTVATGGEKRAQRFDTLIGVPVEMFPISGADSFLDPIKGDIQGYLDFLQSRSFDVILMNAWQTWSSDVILKNINRISGQKFLFSHGISTNLFLKPQPVRSLIRYLAWRPYWWKLPFYLKKLDGVIFLAAEGDGTRFDDLKVAKKIDRNFYIIPNSISEYSKKFILNPVPKYDERNQIISVGSFTWQKGFDFVLRSYAASSYKNVFPLRLFGQERTGYIEYLKNLAGKLDILEDYLSFHEGVSGEDLINEYLKARFFLCGSHTECQPLVILDANVTGTPFVARKTGCLSSMPGGYVVRSPEEAAIRMNDLMSSTKWLELSDAGRLAANNQYHPHNTTRLLIDAIGSP